MAFLIKNQPQPGLGFRTKQCGHYFPVLQLLAILRTCCTLIVCPPPAEAPAEPLAPEVELPVLPLGLVLEPLEPGLVP